VHVGRELDGDGAAGGVGAPHRPARQVARMPAMGGRWGMMALLAGAAAAATATSMPMTASTALACGLVDAGSTCPRVTYRTGVTAADGIANVQGVCAVHRLLDRQ